MLCRDRDGSKAAVRDYDCESHIVPMIVGDSHEATQKAEQLQKLGYYVLPVRPPTVPPGTSRLRFSLNAGITPDELKQLTELL